MGVGAVAIVREFVTKCYDLGELRGCAWEQLTRGVRQCWVCCSKGRKQEDGVGEMHVDDAEMVFKGWTELKLARV